MAMPALKVRIMVNHGHIVFSKANVQFDAPGAQSSRPLECLHRIFNILPVPCASMSYYFRPWDFGIGRVPAQIANHIRLESWIKCAFALQYLQAIGVM